MNELANCVTYGLLCCAFVYQFPNRPIGPDLMSSPIPRRLLLLRAAGRGEVAAPADEVTEPVGGGGTVDGEVVVSDGGEDSFVGVRSFFSIGLFELCRR